MEETTTRTCTKCGVTKDITEYWVVQRTETKDYRANKCRTCTHAERKAKEDPAKKALWQARARDIRKAKMAEDPAYKEAFLAKRRIKQKEWRASKPPYKRKETPSTDSSTPVPPSAKSEQRPPKTARKRAPSKTTAQKLVRQQQRYEEDEKRGRGRPPKPPETLILTDPKPDRPVRYLPEADYEQEIHDFHRKECVKTENKKPTKLWANHTKTQKDENGRHILNQIKCAKPSKDEIKEASDVVNQDLIVIDGVTTKHISDLKMSVTHDREKKYVTISYEVNTETWEEYLEHQKRRSGEYTMPYGLSHPEKD